MKKMTVFAGKLQNLKFEKPMCIGCLFVQTLVKSDLMQEALENTLVHRLAVEAEDSLRYVR